MYRLSSLILFLLLAGNAWAQNPHGPDLKIDCKACHTTGSWKIDREQLSFNHDTVGFELEYRHDEIDCRECHTTLVFNEVESNCVSCHEDVHSMSVGDDCARCHTSKNWLVDNIPEIHEENGFPLAGAHFSLACVDCHDSETGLRWERLGNDCFSCHDDTYYSTTAPNHEASGFSTDCIQCHDPLSVSWTGSDNFHFFFPLTDGHDIADCTACHKGASYSDISPECISCHQDDYNNAQSVDHAGLNFSTDCTQCHGMGPGWSPARFDNHDDNLFPIYSGNHQGVWNTCTDCHLNPNDYSQFSCIICHDNQAELADDHNDVNGYAFNDEACFSCHPKGEE